MIRYEKITVLTLFVSRTNVICSTKVEVYKCQGNITAIRFKEIDESHRMSDQISEDIRLQ